MSSDEKPAFSIIRFNQWLAQKFQRGSIPAAPLTIILAALIGILGGYGAAIFSYAIHFAGSWLLDPFVERGVDDPLWLAMLCLVPAGGLLVVSWLSRTFAPEAEGHGVPEVITAVARRDGGDSPPRGIREGAGQQFDDRHRRLGWSRRTHRPDRFRPGKSRGASLPVSPQHIKVLVAAGAAAGITRPSNAPLAGVIFASEIILGSFAVQSLTPIVVASVLADVVQTRVGEHRLAAAFPELHYAYEGAWNQLPSYVLLGILCGMAAVSFTKLLYFIEDKSKAWFPKWWVRALVLGVAVGVIGVLFCSSPPQMSKEQSAQLWRPPLLCVGYGAVDHVLHLESGGPAG